MQDGYRLLVFDWDGTVLDSIASIVACTQQTLRELEVPPVSDGKVRGAIGLGLRETIDVFCPDCDESLYQKIVERYRHHWIETYSHLPMLFPGAVETLKALSAAGHELGVATGKSRRGLQRDLAKTGVESLFAATKTVDEAPSKPHPGMLIDLMSELGFESRESLMIGDTVHDLAMANAAGVGAVGVTSGSQRREELEPLLPLACLDSIADLPTWLKGA